MVRFSQFCLVGITGVGVDMGLLALLTGFDFLPLALCKAIACEAAILNNFWWNDHWTFRRAAQTSAASRWRRLLRFNTVALGGLGLNVLVFVTLVRVVGLNLFLANGLAMVVVPFFNYGLSRHWAWGGSARAAR
jgi:dolichol-phosphate mannosyltransferase